MGRRLTPGTNASAARWAAQTRKTYLQAVRAFLTWCEDQGAGLLQISPGLVGRYLGSPHETEYKAR